MDGSTFDHLVRAFGASHTRRRVVATLTAAGAIPLLSLNNADARKHKKKKKCKAPKIKCGKKCLTANSCCSDAECGVGVCAGGQCRCLPGQKACGSKCIPDGACCVDADCGSPCKKCQNNVCSAGCGNGELCLANGSCGKSCATNADCASVSNCNCDAAGGVCHVVVPAVCDSGQTCSTTADCPKGTECSDACFPRSCHALCGV